MLSGWLLRDLSDGKFMTGFKIQERVLNDPEFSRHVAMVPLGLSSPQFEDVFQYSVVNEFFLEVNDFN